jgi:MFS family permease
MMTIIIDVMGLGLVFPILPSLFMGQHSVLLAETINENTRYVLYGIGMAVWPLGIFFGTPYLGDLSDKYGRKSILLVTLAGTAVAYALSAIAIYFHSYTLFVLCRFMSGFFASSFPIAQAVIVDVSTFEDKARNLGWITLAGSIGFVIGPLISSLTSSSEFASAFSITTPFWIAGGLAVLNMLSLSVLLKETFQPKADKKIHLAKVFVAFKEIFIDKRTRFYAFLFLLIQVGWGFYMQGIPVALSQRFHQTSFSIGLFFAACGLTYALSQLFLQPYLLRKLSLKNMFLYSTLAVAIITIIGFLIPDLTVQWIVMLIAGPIELSAYTAVISLFSNAVSSDEQGKVMGGTGAIFGVSWVANALLLGNVLQWSVMLPILLCSLFVFISFLCSFKMPESKSAHEPSSLPHH